MCPVATTKSRSARKDVTGKELRKRQIFNINAIMAEAAQRDVVGARKHRAARTQATDTIDNTLTEASRSSPPGLAEETTKAESKEGLLLSIPLAVTCKPTLFTGTVQNVNIENAEVRGVYEFTDVNADTVHTKYGSRSVVRFVVVAMLELSGLDWRGVQAWTDRVFRSDSGKGQRPAVIGPSQSDGSLEAALGCVTDAYERCDNVEDRATALYSLVVSKVAADAEEEDIRDFFGLTKM